LLARDPSRAAATVAGKNKSGSQLRATIFMDLARRSAHR
jgi:hypothetical protein